jgi:hypothetical protein
MGAMSDLAKFYAARLDEDEALALAWARGPWEAREYDVWMPDTIAAALRHLPPGAPARVLREVEAGRANLAMHEDCGFGSGFCGDGGHSWDDDGGCGTLANLASVYSDHPDFNPAWRS